MNIPGIFHSHQATFYETIDVGGVVKSRKFTVNLVGWAIANLN